MGKKFKKAFKFRVSNTSKFKGYDYQESNEEFDSRFQQEEDSQPDVSPLAQEEDSQPDVSPLAQEEDSQPDVSPLAQEEDSQPDVSPLAQEEDSQPDVTIFAQEEDSQPDYVFPESVGLSPDKEVDALLAKKINSFAKHTRKFICVLEDEIWARDTNYPYYKPIPNHRMLNIYLQELQMHDSPNADIFVLSPKEVKETYINILNDIRYTFFAKDFEEHDNLLPLRENVIEVIGGKIKEIPYNQTSKKFKYVIDAAYTPGAEGPNTEKFLKTFLTEDPAAHERFWQAMGCMLFPDIEPKKYVWFYGNGDDGKGILVQFLRKIYLSSIPAVCDSSVDTLFSEHGSAYVHNASIVVLTENNKPMTIGQVSKLKAQTGGDYTQINPKGKAMFNKRCSYKIMVASNHLPSFVPEAIDDALIRRTLFIQVYAPKNDSDKTKELLNWLYDERDYFITQAIKGYALWQVNKKITDCAKDTYLQELVFGGNPIVEFIEENCHISKDFKESTKALKAAFKRWQKDNGLKISLNELNNYLISKDFKFTRPKMEDGSRPHCVSGIKLK